MQESAYDRESEVHTLEGADPGPPEITLPRIRVRSALRRSPRAQHLLGLAIAQAKEDTARAYARNLADLLVQTAREIPFEETMAIYLRVLNVQRGERDSIKARAFAELEGRLPSRVLRTPVVSPDAGFIGRLRRRLRGRRQTRFRARVKAATQRADEEVRQAYLAGADRAVAAMDGLAGPAEAVQLFLEKLDMTADWGERIFHDAMLQPGAAATEGSENAPNRR